MLGKVVSLPHAPDRRMIEGERFMRYGDRGNIYEPKHFLRDSSSYDYNIEGPKSPPIIDTIFV